MTSLSRLFGPPPLLGRLCASVLLLALLGGCSSKPLVRSEAEWDSEPAQQQTLQAQATDQSEAQEDEALKEEQKPERGVVEQRVHRDQGQRQRDVARGMIFEYLPDEPYRIGAGNTFTLALGQAAKVEKVVFYAQSEAGAEQEGTMEIRIAQTSVASGIKVGPDRKRHQILVVRQADHLLFMAEGCETLIDQVKVFGSWASGETRFIMTR